MRGRRLLNAIFLVVMVASLLFTSSGPTSGQVPGPGTGQGSGVGDRQTPPGWDEKIARVLDKMDKQITHADREAVAASSAAAGFELAVMGEAELLAAGDAPYYFSHPNYANSPYPVATTPGYCSAAVTQPCSYDTDCPAAETCEGEVFDFTAGIEKFVDGLPGLGAANANNLGQFIPEAVADTATYADSDYYEIAVIQYREQMHSDLPPTLLRGYVQLTECTVPTDPDAVPLSNAMLVGPDVPTGYCGVTAPHYLGATIAATKDRPVRILFRNLLPVGQGGDLFIPTDTSVMGSGMGPDLNGMPEVDPKNPTCGETPKPAGCFTENRAVLHLHGGLTPWISDGTPHQWITPADEPMPYPDEDLVAAGKENKGVSVEYVPDMWYDAAGNTICPGQVTCAEAGATNNPGPGAQTYYYTNQQSARLLFYHDHSWGITRLNVYAGEAAPYIITDEVEEALRAGALAGLAAEIPLVIQDKTFVPSEQQLAISDNTWDPTRWGGLGNLWLPHVYSPAQNPGDPSGVNQFGRWAYGPWFWPPTNNISYGPTANPYYDPACDPDVAWCEPPLMPGTPFNSMGMEAFHDTPVVNGTLYPTIELAPGEYRFRVLNAASDRFFNLSLYQADATGTEVALNAAEVAAALTDGTIMPTPDETLSPPGPSWIQIGTEGGFLPAPVVLEPQVTTWFNDPTVFNAGNVDGHSLLLGPAERADVLVDLTPYAGKTLILYNDAPAAFPARDPRYDYYTGNGDYRDTGGTPPTLPGYGPNIRTVMQIVVSGTGGTADPAWVNPDRLSALEAAFAHQADGSGVFESGQHPIIVGQGEYNSAYFDPAAPSTDRFQVNGPLNGTVQIFDQELTFRTLPQPLSTALGTLTMAFQPKQIQDEMGEAFDRDYGRMSGFLGVESPNPEAGKQNMILYPFVNPVSELINATNLPKALVDVTPISVADDGSQIWKITHNGVDTHPIHFHLFDVQVLNRVGWDGIIRKPDANELGWKDTVRISPLEDTIVALRPVIPVLPWDLPNSMRPLNPAMPTGSSIMFTNIDRFGDPTVSIVNAWTNFGWEYVWHCHILSHEEMDMMRPIAVSSPPGSPVLSGTRTGNNNNNRRDNLTWTDPSANETGFIVRSALTASGPWTDVITLPADTTSYSVRPPNSSPYHYQIIAINTVGYSATAGYSTLTTSGASNIAMVPFTTVTPPASPTNLTAAFQVGPQVRLTWTDTATTESGFAIERAPVVAGVAGTYASLVTVGPRNGTGSVSYVDVTVAAGNTYIYRVAAVNAGGLSGYAVSNQVAIPAAPLAPFNVLATAARHGNQARVTLTWEEPLANNETGFTIQRATNAAFTANLVTSSVGMNVHTYSTGNLARSTPYYFRVRATNEAGVSAWVNATPFPITTP